MLVLTAFAMFFVAGGSIWQIALLVPLWKGKRQTVSWAVAGLVAVLTWYLIGLSIVAANISTEQMVGMAGQAAGSVGLAVSSWQLMGSVGIVIIAMRNHGGNMARILLREVIGEKEEFHDGVGVVGFDIAGHEAPFPPILFTEAYELAARMQRAAPAPSGSGTPELSPSSVPSCRPSPSVSTSSVNSCFCST